MCDPSSGAVWSSRHVSSGFASPAAAGTSAPAMTRAADSRVVQGAGELVFRQRLAFLNDRSRLNLRRAVPEWDAGGGTGTVSAGLGGRDADSAGVRGLGGGLAAGHGGLGGGGGAARAGQADRAARGPGRAPGGARP